MGEINFSFKVFCKGFLKAAQLVMEGCGVAFFPGAAVLEAPMPDISCCQQSCYEYEHK